MAFLVSPGVNVSEIDLTNVVVAAGTSTGGFAGRFRWGPIEQVMLITDEDNLVEIFQKPNDDNFEHFFTCANFLSYSNAMNVVRAANTTDSESAAPLNATANTDAYVNVQVKTSEEYYNTYDSDFGGSNATSWLASVSAKWAGEIGNTFKISWCPADHPVIKGTTAQSGMTGTVTWTSEGGVIAGSNCEFSAELRVGDVVEIDRSGATSGGIVITEVTTDNAATGTPITGTIVDISAGATMGKRKRSVYSQPSSELAGTATTAADSTTVTGTATAFSAQFVVGDLIIVGGEARKISAIASDTSLTVSEKFIGVNTTANYERKWECASAFPQGAPTTSVFAEDKGLACDEIHVAIVDEDGNWTGTKNEVVETHANLSVIKDAKSADGENIFYANYLNQISDYVWFADHPIFNVPQPDGDNDTQGLDTGGGATVVVPAGDGTGTMHGWGLTSSAAIAQAITGGGPGTQNAFIQSTAPVSTSFQGGTDGADPAAADVIRAYDKMKSAEDVDVSLITTANHNSTVVRHVIQNVAEYRKDCVAFFSPEKADVVNVTDSSTATDYVVDYRDTVNMNSSYAVMDSGWKYQYDKHNDKFRYVPINGDIAGLCARTDAERDPFFSPGGFTRGQIKGVVKLPYNPKQAERDKLYAAQVNPIVTFPGEGTILYGDKTQLTKPSAFDRINVRRLFILLEKAIAN
ncbi:MAG: phage tail sheath subtilisin-like domain-containing protein, partial [Candidatus Pacebacteria bacterium]|nr:phage tail sheath subtilisin-like domain-containing protein [Candidatus Paceibacterota bacterium]